MGLVGIVIYTASLLVGQPHPILKVIKQKLVNISWGKAVLTEDLIKFSHKISTSKAVCVTSHVSTDWLECWPHIHTDCRGTSGCLCYASPVCDSWVSPCLWICIHMYCRDIWFPHDPTSNDGWAVLEIVPYVHRDYRSTSPLHAQTLYDVAD